MTGVSFGGCRGQRWGIGGQLGVFWDQIWGHWDRFGVAEVNAEVLGFTLGYWG